MKSQEALAVIKKHKQGDYDDTKYVVKSLEEKRVLVKAFQRIYEDNWPSYARRITY